MTSRWITVLVLCRRIQARGRHEDLITLQVVWFLVVLALFSVGRGHTVQALMGQVVV